MILSVRELVWSFELKDCHEPNEKSFMKNLLRLDLVPRINFPEYDAMGRE
jgi:hypothetical protein